MNKPKLRFKEFNNEWNSITFDKVFKTIQNNCFSRDLLNGTDEKCTKNVHYGDILIKYGTILDCDNITLPSIDSTVDLKKFNEESYLKDGDILIADTAEDYTVGKACEIVNVHDKVLSGLHTIPCRPLFDFASRFLGYYINSYSYHDSLIPLVTGIKVSSISKSSIAKTIVKYPCLDEQKKIAEFLSKVDEVIAEREEEVKDLEKQKKGLMQKIFSQELRFTDSNNNPYPDWKEKNVGNLGTVITGSTPKTEDKSNYGNDFLWCSPADLGSTKYITQTQKMLSSKGFNCTRKLPANSILVTCIGSTIGKIGISSCEMSTNQQINSIIPCNNNSDFIYYALIYSFPRYMSVIATQAVPIINKTEFEKLTLQVPCLEEQQKIANLLSKLDELIEEKKALLSDWQSFKKGLLQQMFV